MELSIGAQARRGEGADDEVMNRRDWLGPLLVVLLVVGLLGLRLWLSIIQVVNSTN